MKTTGKLAILLLAATLAVVTSSQVAAAEASPTVAPTWPARDRWQQRPAERPERLEKLREQQADLKERRQERVDAQAEQLKARLQQIIDRFTNIIDRLRQHMARIQARADELNDQRGIDTSAVDAALDNAQTYLSEAEQAASDLKAQIGTLDDATTPGAIVATFRGGMAQIRTRLLAAREQIRVALRTLVSLAGESRLTTTPTPPPAP